MNILFVARGYPTKKYKMNGIFEFDQAKALKMSGVNIIYVAVDVRSIRRWRKWGIEKKMIDGINVYAINIPCGKLPHFILDKIKVWSLKYIYKLLTKEHGQPDLIHAHFIGSGYTVAQAFNQYTIPLILTEHSSQMNKNKLTKYYKNIGDYTYKHMDKVIAVSNYLANNIKRNFNVEVSTIPNIVDLSTFKSEDIMPNIKKNNVFTFVSVGGLNPNKRMDLLIKSFYEVFKNIKNVTLKIYGEGPERLKLENLIEELDLKNQVFLLGLVSRSEIATQMKKSDCFVLVSKLETFGVAYIEAMCTGLPVIASRCGGPEGFINESNGLLVDVDSSKALSDAMSYMYKYADTYDAGFIIKETLEKFAPNTVVRRIVKEYDEILNENKEC